jgi:hypothetical protein
MEHFGSICNNPLTKDVSIILLMNKFDLFGRKIRHRRIKDLPEFCKYKGNDSSSTDGVNYFLKNFIEQYKPNGIIKEKKINHFVTNLLDTEMTNEVILQCKDLIDNPDTILRKVESLPLKTSKVSSKTSSEISLPRSTTVVQRVGDSSELPYLTERSGSNSSYYSQYENSIAIEYLRSSRCEEES